MTTITRRNLLSGAAILGGAAVFASAWPRRAAAADALTVYNGQHRETTEALVAAFTKETGIAVDLRNGESSQLAGQIGEEGANSPADIFYSEQCPPIAYVAEKGLLEKIDASTLQQIPAAYAAKDGTWIGATIRGRVIAYNKKLVQPAALPKSILDLKSPEYKGKFAYAIRDGFQEQIMAILVLKGRKEALDWLRGVKANGVLYSGNRAAMNAVEKGDVAMAITNNYYWYSMVKETGSADKLNSALHFVGKQDPGAVLAVSAAGILKSSKRKADAQKFIAFMVGPAGQQAQVNTTGEYPVRPGIVSPFKLDPIERYEAAPVTSADFGSAAEAYVLEREAGII
jgi:iron(III) transport system substrate-binding protein